MGRRLRTAQPLTTSFLDPVTFANPVKQDTAFARASSAGATRVRLVLHWVDVAPYVRPANPADHLDPAYNWPPFDAQVQAAHARGLAPFVTISIAPTWATNDGAGGSDHVTRPSPTALANFARAAATRYNGAYTPPGASSPLPAVRVWEIWNEPNRDYFLMPQYGSSAAGPIVSANWYRTMLARGGRAPCAA